MNSLRTMPLDVYSAYIKSAYIPINNPEVCVKNVKTG